MANTKARSEQINSLAAELAARENVNPAEGAPRDTRYYANLLAEMDGRQNGIEAYRQAWARYLRRARHPVNPRGGARPGAGRKPTPVAADSGDSPAKPADTGE